MAAVRRRWASRSASSATATPAAMPPMPSTAQSPISPNTGAAIAERVDHARRTGSGSASWTRPRATLAATSTATHAALVAQQAQRTAIGAQQGPDRARRGSAMAAPRFAPAGAPRPPRARRSPPSRGHAPSAVDQVGEVAVGAVQPRRQPLAAGSGRSRRRSAARRRAAGRARAGGPWRPRSGAAGSGRARRRAGASRPGCRRRGRRRSCGRGGAALASTVLGPPSAAGCWSASSGSVPRTR